MAIYLRPKIIGTIFAIFHKQNAAVPRYFSTFQLKSTLCTVFFRSLFFVSCFSPAETETVKN
jgi:hypothetical protein